MQEPLDMKVTRVREILGDMPEELQDFILTHESCREWWEKAVNVIWYVVGL